MYCLQIDTVEFTLTFTIKLAEVREKNEDLLLFPLNKTFFMNDYFLLATQYTKLLIVVK